MKFVFVTGSKGNDYNRPSLRLLVESHPIAIFVHGGCQSGLDAEVSAICCGRSPRMDCSASDVLSLEAGEARSGEMLNLALSLRANGHNVEWHAFPGAKSCGTWGCVRQAESAGFDVNVYQPMFSVSNSPYLNDVSMRDEAK